jgi:cyclopropane fatty-acyl-phospholipid synthase-like methyltransferase
MLRRLFFSWLYLGKPPWDTGISPPELVAFIQAHPPGRSLDLGCGTGTNVITLAQHGWQAAGIDFVPRAIRQAQRKAQALGLQVDLRVGDAARMASLDGPYDLVLDMGCFHGLKPGQRREYRDNLVSRLANGGTYLLYGFLSGSSESMPGITQADVDAFGERLELVSRQVGSDHSRAVSAWFTYRKNA